MRINRNIVECKYQPTNYEERLKAELIETLWNVNHYVASGSTALCVGINRNIVECKFDCELSVPTLARGINRNIVECKYNRPGYLTLNAM